MDNLGFWKYNGKNGLAGLESTLEELPDGRTILVKNPISAAVMEDRFIVFALQTSRQARSDFNRLFPDLTVGEQDRLSTLILENPRATSLLTNDQEFFDAIQHRNVTDDIRLRMQSRTRARNIGVDTRLEVGS